MAAVVRGLARSPLAERYDFTTITTHQTGSAARRAVVWAGGLARLAAWCVRHPCGVIHIHAAVRGSFYRKAVAILLARLLRHPVLLHVHAGPGDLGAFADGLNPAARRFLRAALGRADAVVSVSAASAASIEQGFGIGPVGVVPNAPPPAPARVAAPHADHALFLGGFEDPAKGGQDLVGALPALLDVAPGLALALAGPGDPPPELQRLLGERVAWRGWLDEDAKRRELEASGIVLMPSRSEGQPIVLLEAMAYGRAVVATAVGGIPDTLADAGVVVPAGDADALVAAVAQLAGDAGRVARLGDAARARADALGAENVYGRLDALYEELGSRA